MKMTNFDTQIKHTHTLPHIWMVRTDNDTSDGHGRFQKTTEGQSALHKEKRWKREGRDD